MKFTYPTSNPTNEKIRDFLARSGQRGIAILLPTREGSGYLNIVSLVNKRTNQKGLPRHRSCHVRLTLKSRVLGCPLWWHKAPRKPSVVSINPWFWLTLRMIPEPMLSCWRGRKTFCKPGSWELFTKAANSSPFILNNWWKIFTGRNDMKDYQRG